MILHFNWESEPLFHPSRTERCVQHSFLPVIDPSIKLPTVVDQAVTSEVP